MYDTMGSLAVKNNYFISPQSFDVSLFERFIDYTDRKSTTVKGYLTCLKQFAKWLSENGINQPCRDDIKAYRDYLRNSDFSAGTQQQYLRAVKHFFKWTASEGIYPNIADNVHGARVKNDCHKKDALPRTDLEKVVETIDRSTEQGKRLYAIFRLCAKCGLRTIEITRANVEDIKIVGGDAYLYVQPKGHDDKDSPKYLTPDDKRAIDDYLSSRTEKLSPKSPLFTATSNRSKGKRIATTTISTMIKSVLVSAGFDSNRITAHSLRATACTAAHEAGMPLFEVQQLMGHQDPATTEIYIKDQEILRIEKKGRIMIERFYKGEITSVILPELESEIMSLSYEQQNALLSLIKAKKGSI